MNVLVTGGAGYIGSHTLLALLVAQPTLQITVVDDLSSCGGSMRDGLATVRQVEALAGVATGALRLVEVHLGQPTAPAALASVFARASPPITAVLHFAALKSVAESAERPLRYYEANVAGLLHLLGCTAGSPIARL